MREKGRKKVLLLFADKNLPPRVLWWLFFWLRRQWTMMMTTSRGKRAIYNLHNRNRKYFALFTSHEVAGWWQQKSRQCLRNKWLEKSKVHRRIAQIPSLNWQSTHDIGEFTSDRRSSTSTHSHLLINIRSNSTLPTRKKLKKWNSENEKIIPSFSYVHVRLLVAMMMTSRLEDSRERKKIERSELNGNENELKEEQNREFFPFFSFLPPKSTGDRGQNDQSKGKWAII